MQVLVRGKRLRRCNVPLPKPAATETDAHASGRLLSRCRTLIVRSSDALANVFVSLGLNTTCIT